MFAISIIVGASAGGLAWVLTTLLPHPWPTLAGTSALWGLVPFGVALRDGVRTQKREAALTGVVTMLAMVAIWCALVASTVTLREVLLWTVVGFAAGALCGLAGYSARSRQRWFRALALAFMGGLVAGEGLYGVVLIGGPQWWLELVVGLVLPLALGRTLQGRLVALVGAAVFAAALLGVFWLYDAVAVM